MTDPYLVLDLSPGAGDVEVRGRYLDLTREFPPEQFPEKSAAVRAAYDKIRTADDRARHWLFGYAADDDLDALIDDVRHAAPRPRLGLMALSAVLRGAKR